MYTLPLVWSNPLSGLFAHVTSSGTIYSLCGVGDESQFASGAQDTTVRFWDLRSQTATRVYKVCMAVDNFAKVALILSFFHFHAFVALQGVTQSVDSKASITL